MTKGAIPLPTAAAHARRLAMTLYDGAGSRAAAQRTLEGGGLI